jgi:hypothetical protein
LLKAQTINELVVESDERASLWQSLRERAELNQGYKVDLPDDIDPSVLKALLGIKELQGNYQEKDVEW